MKSNLLDLINKSHFARKKEKANWILFCNKRSKMGDNSGMRAML